VPGHTLWETQAVATQDSLGRLSGITPQVAVLVGVFAHSSIMQAKA